MPLTDVQDLSTLACKKRKKTVLLREHRAPLSARRLRTCASPVPPAQEPGQCRATEGPRPPPRPQGPKPGRPRSGAAPLQLGAQRGPPRGAAGRSHPPAGHRGRGRRAAPTLGGRQQCPRRPGSSTRSLETPAVSERREPDAERGPPASTLSKVLPRG